MYYNNSGIDENASRNEAKPHWSGSYKKSKKKFRNCFFFFFDIRLDPFVKMLIYFLVFVIISSDNNELYINKYDKNKNNIFSSVSGLEKSKKKIFKIQFRKKLYGTGLGIFGPGEIKQISSWTFRTLPSPVKSQFRLSLCPIACVQVIFPFRTA